MESVGSQLHVPYRMCLAATLPMILYVPADILQCDDDCRSRYGMASVDKALLSETLTWLAVIVIVFPMLCPILLRMLQLLQKAFTVQSQTLQFVLAAVSAITTFTCGILRLLCTGMVYGLTGNIFQQGLIGFVPFYLLLIILLLLQLRCLLGTHEAVAGSSADGTYRPLAAADAFSM